MEYRLSEIAKVVGGAVHGDAAAVIRAVSTDTRTVEAGALFVALRGERFDAHDFLAAAAEAGAAALLVETRALDAARAAGLAAVAVDDTLTALGDLAAHHRGRLPAKVVGVTGSNGKTTTKEMLAAILALEGPTVKSPASFNNFIGVPLTLFRAAPEHRYAVVEMGANAPGEIARLAAIARPEVGVITNVGEAHLEGFGDLAGVAAAKTELLGGIAPGGVAVLNGDDPWLRRAASGFAGRVAWFGDGRDALAAAAVKADDDGVSFVLDGMPVRLPAGGAHNVQNALAAAAAARALGVANDVVARGLAAYTPPPMRMEEWRGAVTLVNDAYNANPASMRAALAEVARRRVEGRKVFVCGDMLEMGPAAGDLHRALGAAAAGSGVDLLCAVGEQAGAVGAGAGGAGMPAERVRVWPDADAAVRALPALLRRGDLVWLKGSRRVGLERVADAVREKADALQTAL
jgi:UDP-N-acetylmuramoyl-tripeptide--D-alanyl-D-alanine ligase